MEGEKSGFKIITLGYPDRGFGGELNQALGFNMNLDNKIIDINTLSLQNSVYKDVVLTAEELGILQDMANEYESIPTTKYLNSLSEKLYNGEVARPEVIGIFRLVIVPLIRRESGWEEKLKTD